MLAGIEPFAAAELEALGVEGAVAASGALRFGYAGPWGPLHRLRRVVAVYRQLDFAVPRPRALLGDAHFGRLQRALDEVLSRAPEPFTGFRFGAAGSDSAVFARLAARVSAATGLRFDPDGGDLLLRVRPAPSGDGWEVLVRLAPRPLSARSWRTCNLPGGLNATLAVVVNDLVGVRPDDRYLNAMCGSGTLLIERALAGAAAELLACDLAPAALRCGRENLAAAGLERRARLFEADATALPLADARLDVLTADLPWGDAVGSHEANRALYPSLLAELARVAAPGARCALITHEVTLFERLLADEQRWRLERAIRVAHGGHHPRLYLLRGR